MNVNIGKVIQNIDVLSNQPIYRNRNKYSVLQEVNLSQDSSNILNHHSTTVKSVYSNKNRSNAVHNKSSSQPIFKNTSMTPTNNSNKRVVNKSKLIIDNDM